MQFPLSWLREFCNPPLNTEQLAKTLTMAGLEVEELRPVAPPFNQVVVGQIVQAEPHPNADRLRVCQVDVGAEQLLAIVCGAANARVGIKVPCALVGAQLPPADKPLLIKLGNLRGVPSHGMLCSARELGLLDEASGLLELPDDAPLGQNIRDYLKLDDTLLTLKLTPNLAHCLSVYGVARELAALTGAPLKPLPVGKATVSHADQLPVKISAPDLCGRFAGRIVRQVNPQARTPQWMVDRLARCGQRSVTALVDISNYVMFECGQPSHIFDLNKLSGGLEVRWGKKGEQLKLLNSTTITVDEQVGVIADAAQLESLAGIMGGDACAVGEHTQDVYVEAAFWHPSAIAGRARRYNFSTDAAHRFERGVDPQHTVQCLERITALILEICGGQAGPVDDVQVSLPQVKPVVLRVARAAKVIGMTLTQAQCVDALQRLGLPLVEGDGTITVTAPSYRFDLQIEEDLIEEVVRVLGYNQLPVHPPLAPITARHRLETQRSLHSVRRTLAARGYQETINFSFVEERWEHELAGNAQPIRLLNPIASHMNVLRSSLLGSLLQVLKFNLNHKAASVNVFELGRVFLRDASVQDTDNTVSGLNQPMRVAGLRSGLAHPLQWGQAARAVDFFDVKSDVEMLLAPRQAIFTAAEHPALHPGRCANVAVGGVVIGFVGELHPRWRQDYELTQPAVLFELDLAAVLAQPLASFLPVSKLQPVERDIAVIVDQSITHAMLLACVYSAQTAGLLKMATLFDVYQPEQDQSSMRLGEKSLAVRLLLSSDVATLTDVQIDSAVAAVLNNLQSQLQARLRT